jgi:hypothetical protein
MAERLLVSDSIGNHPQSGRHWYIADTGDRKLSDVRGSVCNALQHRSEHEPWLTGRFDPGAATRYFRWRSHNAEIFAHVASDAIES